MGFKRVHSHDSNSALDSPSSSSSSPAGPSPAIKRPRMAAPDTLQGLKIYIVPSKIDPKKFEDIVETAERVGAVICGSPEDAELVVTAIGMRKRLERHITWDTAVRFFSLSSRPCRLIDIRRKIKR